MIQMTPELESAARLMEQQRFEEAGAAYQRIATADSALAPVASMQAGVAAFFLRRFDLAIQWYEHAGRVGYDASEVREHVEEARQAMGAPPPQSEPRVQYGFPEAGPALVNVDGGGWQPYTHPRPGDAVMLDTGGMFTFDGTRGWVQSADDDAPPPKAGDAVFLIQANAFFVIQADGSWLPRR